LTSAAEAGFQTWQIIAAVKRFATQKQRWLLIENQTISD
jgi:hypothetical protein